MFTPLPLFQERVYAQGFQLGRFDSKFNVELSSQRWNDYEQNVHADTNTDHWNGVEQTSDKEHFALQHRSQFRLTRRTFEQFAAEQSEAQSSTQSTQTNQQRNSDQSQTHFTFSQLDQSEVK
jgi:hypothetical protein